MSMQGYSEGNWPQQSYSLSQDMSAHDVSGEVQGYAGLTQYDPAMYSAGPYEAQTSAGAMSEFCPVRAWGRG